jgi:pilus assembly protein CpaF
MRPDRIIIGEVRAGEALDMLQAMNTGHEGSLTTVHANSARDALMRLETIVAMGGLQLPTEAVRRYISSALNVVIHVSRLMDGSRKVVSIQEITGMEGPVITMQELFAFEQTHIGPKGIVRGRFRAKGILPRFMDKFKVHGMQIPLEIFDENSSVEV